MKTLKLPQRHFAPANPFLDSSQKTLKVWYPQPGHLRQLFNYPTNRPQSCCLLAPGSTSTFKLAQSLSLNSGSSRRTLPREVERELDHWLGLVVPSGLIGWFQGSTAAWGAFRTLGHPAGCIQRRRQCVYGRLRNGVGFIVSQESGYHTAPTSAKASVSSCARPSPGISCRKSLWRLKYHRGLLRLKRCSTVFRKHAFPRFPRPTQ